MNEYLVIWEENDVLEQMRGRKVTAASIEDAVRQAGRASRSLYVFDLSTDGVKVRAHSQIVVEMI